MTSVIDIADKMSVSSVLNRDVKHFGKRYMFDGSEETCWNSDHGSPQWVFFEFNQPVLIQEVHMQFQGGFVGKECHLIGTECSGGQSVHLADFFPDDINTEQVFQLQEQKQVVSLRILFSSSSDFYGRITLYKLDLLGSC